MKNEIYKKAFEISSNILSRAISMIVILAEKNNMNREKLVKSAIEGALLTVGYIDFGNYKVSEQAIKEFEEKWGSDEL